MSSAFRATMVATLLLGGVACNQHRSDKPEAGGEEVDFVRDVKPLLTSTCVICHHSETMLGGLNLETRKTAFGGGDGPAFIVPGEPDSSLLYLVTENPHGKISAQAKMPAMENISLTDDERDLLRRWIEQGADWPSGEEGWVKPIKIDLKES
ncbi:MAG: c-type cytochrome domain-containing protein [Verrucomicrobiales bacterium]